MKRDLLSTSAAIAMAIALTVGTGVAVAQDTTETGTAVAPATAVDAEALLGRTIENADGDNVGEIENVVIAQNGEVKYVVVGVGGFLGIGEKHVALAWEELNVSDNGETVTTAATKEQLEALPDHEFPADVQTGSVYSDPVEQPDTAETTAGEEATVPEQPAASAETQTAVPEQQATVPEEPATTTTGEATAPEQQATVPEEPAASTDQQPMSTGEETAALETAPAPDAMGIRASELVGAEVTNPQGESIGEINEVVLGADGAAQGLVIDVGGFLGVGERRVMVDWSDVTIRSEENGTLEVATSLDKPGVENLPDYTMPAAQ